MWEKLYIAECLLQLDRMEKSFAKKPVADPVPITKILEVGRKMKNPELRAILYVLYLTGARISEVLQLKYGDFMPYKKFNKKTGVEEERLEAKLITLKNRHSHSRVIPLSDRRNEEKVMHISIRRYLAALPITDTRTKVFRMNRFKVYDELNKFTVETTVYDEASKTNSTVEYRLHPHFIRHCRLTDLANYYHAQEKILVAVAGHSDSRTITRYVKTSLEELR